MPEQATSPTEVRHNNTDIFRGFSDPSVEEMTDEDTEGGASWEVAGSFPNPTNSSHIATSFDDSNNHHVFSDETFDSSYPTLQMVKEGSLESASKTSKDEASTSTGGGGGGGSGDHESPQNLQLQQDDTMAVSIASSDTPSINNLGSSAALKSDIMTVLKKAKKKSPSAAAAATAGNNAANIKQNPSSSSSGFYPYNIYQSLSKSDINKKKSPSSSDYLNVEDNNRILNDSRVTASTTASSNSARSVTGGSRNTKGGDREVPSNSSTLPRQHITPPHLSIFQDDQGESASMLSDQQSGVLDTSHGGIVMDTNHSIQPYSSTTQGGASYSGRMGGGGGGGNGGGGVGETFSVMSVRSRGTKGKPRYLIRHTLATSQQVNANPATMLKNIFIGIEQERHMHKLAAQNLRAVHNWCLFLPAILLSLFSGVVVFVFEADLGTTDDTNIAVYSSIVVGIASLISVFWQALSKQLDLGTRATIHEITASALKRLSEDIPLTLASTDNIPAEYVALVGEKLAQATDSCPSIVPHKLESAFNLVSDRMVLMLRPPMGQPPRKHVQKIDFMNLYSTAYDELTTEIIHYWAWPFAYPQPRTVSNAALQNFKAIVIEGRERNKRCSTAKGWVRQVLCCGLCSENKLERSLFDVVPAASVGENSNAYSTATKQQHQLHPNSTPSTNDKHHQYSYPIRNSVLGSEV